MKLTITKLIRKNTDKEGKPLLTRDGRNYERLAIQVKEYGQDWLSGFSSNWNRGWIEGMILETGKDLEITEVAKDGKIYKNFERADPLKALEARIEKVEQWVKAEIAKRPKESHVKYPEGVDDYQEPSF